MASRKSAAAPGSQIPRPGSPANDAGTSSEARIARSAVTLLKGVLPSWPAGSDMAAPQKTEGFFEHDVPVRGIHPFQGSKDLAPGASARLGEDAEELPELFFSEPLRDARKRALARFGA